MPTPQVADAARRRLAAELVEIDKKVGIARQFRISMGLIEAGARSAPAKYALAGIIGAKGAEAVTRHFERGARMWRNRLGQSTLGGLPPPPRPPRSRPAE